MILDHQMLMFKDLKFYLTIMKKNLTIVHYNKKIIKMYSESFNIIHFITYEFSCQILDFITLITLFKYYHYLIYILIIELFLYYFT